MYTVFHAHLYTKCIHICTCNNDLQVLSHAITINVVQIG